MQASTSADLRRPLFIDGITTAATVSDLSGRGVGRDALLECILAFEKRAIDTARGKGTTLPVTLPQSATRSLSAMAAAA